MASFYCQPDLELSGERISGENCVDEFDQWARLWGWLYHVLIDVGRPSPFPGFGSPTP